MRRVVPYTGVIQVSFEGTPPLADGDTFAIREGTYRVDKGFAPDVWCAGTRGAYLAYDDQDGRYSLCTPEGFDYVDICTRNEVHNTMHTSGGRVVKFGGPGQPAGPSWERIQVTCNPAFGCLHLSQYFVKVFF